MPPVPSKSQFVSLAMILVGLICHVKGMTLSDTTSASLTQLIGGLFDAIGLGMQWVVYLHTQNKQAIADHVNAPVAEAHPATTPTAGTVAKMLILGLVCANLVGCGPFNQLSDQDKVSQAETLFTTGVTALSAAKSANLIDAQDYHTIVGLETTISATFDMVHADLDAGGKLDGNTAWSVLNTALQNLAVYQWRFTNGPNSHSSHPGPASAPTSSRSTDYSTTKGWAVIDYRATRYHRAAA